MSLLDRHLPLLSWIPKARAARFLPTDYRARTQAAQRAYRTARALDLPVLTSAGDPPDVAALQCQLGRRRNARVQPLAEDPRTLPLGAGEVVFAPQSLGVNRYITGYGGAYLFLDIGQFTDPRGVQNTRSFKTVPAWGRCRVLRSNHPEVAAGSVFYGFWPLAAFCVRRVSTDGPVVQQELPRFSGPREWLKLIRMDDYAATDYAIDNYEYVKIGITFARELGDRDFFGGRRLVISSASSASGQIIAMAVKERYPDFPVVGLTSDNNLGRVRAMSYFDAAYSYGSLAAAANDGPSLYFDVLGKEEITTAVFDHFRLARWWIYGEGSTASYWRLLRRNRRGTFYTNLVDSYDYQLRHGITDGELLSECVALAERHQLARRWYADARLISTGRALFDLYRGYVDGTHTGERFIYRSPLVE